MLRDGAMRGSVELAGAAFLFAPAPREDEALDRPIEETDASCRWCPADPIEAETRAPAEGGLARQVEALRGLPREERRRQAEELLRSLTAGADPSFPAPAAVMVIEPPVVEPIVSEIAVAELLSAELPPAELPAEPPPPSNDDPPLPAAWAPSPIPHFLATKLEIPTPRRKPWLPVPALAAGLLIAAAMLGAYGGNFSESGASARAESAAASMPALVPAPAAVQSERVQIPTAQTKAMAVLVMQALAMKTQMAAGPALQPQLTAPVVAGPVTVVPVSTAGAAESVASAPRAEDAVSLVERGDEFLKTGDIATARSFYARAAEDGDGPAAIGMGETYDPVFLARIGVFGVVGDPAQAASWYAKAHLPEGDKRLSELFADLAKHPTPRPTSRD